MAFVVASPRRALLEIVSFFYLDPVGLIVTSEVMLNCNKYEEAVRAGGNLDQDCIWLQAPFKFDNCYNCSTAKWCCYAAFFKSGIEMIVLISIMIAVKWKEYSAP